MTTESNTISVLVVAPGHEAQEVEVSEGTTVAELAAEVGLENAESLPAVDEMGNMMKPTDVIAPDSGTISYVFKLAGASA